MTQELAHDLRGYLQLIVSCAQLIQLEAGPAPAGHAALILEGALEMERALSGGTSTRVVGQDAVGALRALTERARPFAMEKGITLAFSGGGGRFPEYAGLSRAALNLIINALRHTPAGGRVEVRVRAGDCLRLTVSDTGPGVAPALRQSMFQPGASDSGGGTGLAVADSFARQAGGCITYRTAPGGGAEFELTVPHNGNLQFTSVKKQSIINYK